MNRRLVVVALGLALSLSIQAMSLAGPVTDKDGKPVTDREGRPVSDGASSEGPSEKSKPDNAGKADKGNSGGNKEHIDKSDPGSKATPPPKSDQKKTPDVKKEKPTPPVKDKDGNPVVDKDGNPVGSGATGKGSAKDPSHEKSNPAVEGLKKDSAATEQGEDVDPVRQWKEILPPDKLAERTKAIRAVREAIAKSRGVEVSEVAITSLYREDSEAHKRGAFDVSVKGAKDVLGEAKAASKALGGDHLVIVEQPNVPKAGEQTNTQYRGGELVKQQTGAWRKSGGQFHATGPHIHAQPDAPKK